MSLEFLLTTLIIVASPGTGVLVTLAAGLSAGPRGAIAAAFGCTLGILPHLAAAITGLATLLHASPLAFQMLKAAGVAYLLSMAVRSLRADGPLAAVDGSSERSSGHIVVNAVALNLLNPKLPLFFVAFLPQFLDPASPQPIADMVRLSGVFMALTFAVFAVYGLCAARLRRQVLTRPELVRWLQRLFAAGFLALGVKLAATSLR
ncbi:LysE family translocator [Pannonibacter tanglangensis]|uniref:LysE family transporter n=1 Tax=Pannonibacter tanglangensis TaxID=2750084 RepID=A0ABW9ZGF2_9HYPH|nr:LysE family translocator [Pannonibacter sp. XCT-34]NBN63821.1 LysE family transporter [Pannonibacter sp. XCT-34]